MGRTKIELAKVIVLSKNEYDLIEDFLVYHGHIFGFHNIVVVDNGSDDPRVLEVYERFSKKGVTIETDAARGMASMAQIMTDAINRHKNTCKFIIPLDTDEFMYLPGAPHVRDVNTAKDMILKHIMSVPDDVSVIRYKRFMGSVANPKSRDYVTYKHQRPAQSIVDFFDQGWDKLIVRASTFMSISQGNHHAVTTIGRTMTSVLLGLLHFHDTGSSRKLERCVMSMLGYGQVTKEDLVVPVDDRLKKCDDLVMQKMFGGHRVEQYRELVRREAVCKEAMRLLSRLPLPKDAALMAKDDRLWSKPGLLAAEILARTPMTTGRDEIVTPDDVVFHEEMRESGVEQVDMLSAFLAELLDGRNY